MAHLVVVQAVEARLKAEFKACPIYVENETLETEADNGPWILVDFPFTTAKQASIGAPGENRWREEGAFRVRLALPIGTGTHQGRAWLDAIAALFRGQEFGGVRTYAPASAVASNGSAIGAEFVLSMAVPYDFTLLG